MNRRDRVYSIPFKSLARVGQGRLRLPLAAILLSLLTVPAQAGTAAAGNANALAGDKIRVYRLRPEARGGSAYKLVYVVPVQIEVYWGFKTDFDNDFLTRNKYIAEHRFLSRDGNTVVTENRYTQGPKGLYRWQTTVIEAKRRLEYVLVNPEEIGQRFHYGYIQLAPARKGTLVTQVAYFDFWGVSLWAAYPWAGGMKDFLTYTARWEQGMALQLKDRYSGAGHFPRGDP